MSIFTKILEKLGMKKAPSTPAPTQGTTSAGTPSTARPGGSTATPGTTGHAPTPGSTSTARPTNSTPSQPAVTGSRQPSTTTTAAPAQPQAPKAISEVDVVKQLEDKGRGTGLDWKVSIVDLLKLLDIDSSREARNELAQELGCPPELMHDSAKMNTWLHKEVLRRIAQNGGNIPQNLLD
ncbi:MAG TPA: DUF3597 family protein [Anaerolineales bacterium]|nr:DUF3597 family protein [Anaerolineales bacterium]